MVGGYTGKMLIINLTNQKTSVKKTNMKDAEKYIGAKGLGAKILYDMLPEKTDPLSEQNILMFTTGPLTGTTTQTSGRGTVVTKSPQTGLFLDSHFGGFFAPEIKKAGWDFIIIKGKSKKPVYLVIKDEEIIFKEADDLWGNECLITHDKIIEKEGKVKTAVIGPAGENLVKFSAITIDGHRHAGRAGPGAVMGSKNLKAIALKGTGKIPLHKPDEFKEKTKEVLKKIQENDFVPVRKKLGTPYWVNTVNDEGFIPTKNFQEGFFEYGKNLNAETMQKSIVDKGGACYNCVIACWNKSSIKKGKYKDTNLIGPEYETIALMGTNLGMETIENLAYLNDRCNELGFDSISLGVVLSFAVEAYMNKVFSKKEIGNNDIGWGKTDELASLMKKIAYRDGKIPDILAEGVKIASEKLGKQTSKYAVHCKGLEVPGYDPRGSFGMSIAYATSDRGACHQRAWVVKADLYDPEYERFSMDKKSKMVIEVQNERAVFFSLVLCDFAPISEEDCVEMFNLSTGFNHTVESYLITGDRIWNLIRMFNIREGLDTKDDDLPERFYNDTFTKGPAKNVKFIKEDFQKELQNYYKFRGWDEKGIPTNEKLKELNLENI